MIPAIEPAAAKSEAHLSETSFASLEGKVSSLSLRAIAEVLRFERLSLVQEATLPLIMAGQDVLAKAKTGTGKTVGFLLPSIERLLKAPRQSQQISILAISPTRELASQIATEAKQLCTFHQGVEVGVFVGGTNMNKDHKTLQHSVDILVATPGRLLDHLQNTKGFVSRLEALSVLVLDEADQLLEQGFRIELEKIIAFLPKKRQTLLFSATVPTELENFLRLSLREDHQFIDTVGEEDQTNTQVEQSVVVCELAEHIHMIDVCLQRHIAQCQTSGEPFKVIVFFATARAAGFYAQLFAESGLEVVEMHSRKPQGYRTKASARFRDHANLVMFSSDVSARGMDYGGVTMVLQVGLTDREQYIHRLGRTARAGSQGQGVLLLSPFETCLLRDLKDLPIQRVAAQDVQQWTQEPLRPALAKSLVVVDKKGSNLHVAAQQAYQAFLGYYNSNLRRIKWSKTELVKQANEYASFLGLSSQPELLRRTVGKMGLKGVPGLQVR